MKKLFIIGIAALAVCTACNNKQANTYSEEDARIDSLQRVIDQKDLELTDMINSINDIQEGLRLISEAENKITILKSDEGQNSAEQIKDYMRQITEQMNANRERIAKLRKQLKAGNAHAEQLEATINSLNEQMNAKEQEIEALKAELDAKNQQIAELDQAVTDLNQNVNTLTEQSNQKTQTINAQDKALHTAYYVFGTKKELKEQNILSSGEVLQGNYNQNYFTQIDTRSTKEIKLYSKSAELLTNHPAGSYTLTQDSNKQYVLKITNADRFWSASKYLVILVK